jgi:hypothetical protein
MSRAELTRGFLWFSVVGGAIGLVVAGAWGAAPPTSIALMPYGPRYPMNLLPALERAGVSGDPWSAHQWMENPA